MLRWSLLVLLCLTASLGFADAERRLVQIIVVDNLGGSSKLPEAVENGIELKTALAKLQDVTMLAPSVNEGTTTVKSSIQKLAKQARAGDAIYIYYLGHGFKSGGQSYWATGDTRAKSGQPVSSEGSISTEDLYLLLRDTKASDIVIFNDACRNLATGASSADGWSGFAKRLVEAGGEARHVLVVHSTRDGRVGLSHPDVGGSLLCRFIIDASEGNAGKFRDLEREGSEVRTPLLQDYVAKRYKAFANRFPGTKVEPEFDGANLPGDGLYFCGKAAAPTEIASAALDRKSFWKAMDAMYKEAQSNYRSLATSEMTEVNEAMGEGNRREVFETRKTFPGAESCWLQSQGLNSYYYIAVFGVYDSDAKAFDAAEKLFDAIGAKEDRQKIPVSGESPNLDANGKPLSKYNLGDIANVLLGSKDKNRSNGDTRVPEWQVTRSESYCRIDRQDSNAGQMTAIIRIVPPSTEYLLISQRISKREEARKYANKRMLFITFTR